MKKVFPILALAIIASIVGFQTLAYFTTQTTTTNVITTGSIDIEINTFAIDENGETVVFNPEIRNIVPGDTCSQMPYVKNTGTEDFYARVYLNTKITNNGNELPIPLAFNIDETKWILDEDGWYRYVNIIKAGETAPDPLFTEVYYPLEMGNEYIGSFTDITLQAQSVQSEYNEHENVLDVQGWPEVGGVN